MANCTSNLWMLKQPHGLSSFEISLKKIQFGSWIFPSLPAKSFGHNYRYKKQFYFPEPHSLQGNCLVPSARVGFMTVVNLFMT